MTAVGTGESPTMEIELAPWTADDKWLIDATMGDPAMTEYLGGPESEEKLAERHQRYLDHSSKGMAGMMKIVRVADQRVLGNIGYWLTEWDGEEVFEMGWSVLPKFQGQGVATQATRMIVDVARTDGRRRYLHAFPRIDNAASNAVCRKAGLTNLGVVQAEFPPGNPITCNNWRIDLKAGERGGS